MKFHIVAPGVDRERAKTFKGILEDNGHEVVSRWLDQDPPDGLWPIPDLPSVTEWQRAREEVKRRMEDVNASDIVLVLTESSRGTAPDQCEFGYALGMGKHIWMLGPMINVFYATRGVQHLALGDFLERISHG